MKKIALLLVILALVFCFVSCDKDGVEEIIERLPYDIEGWHEHSWDNWELVYDEVNVNLVCSLCEANVKSHPISQGLEIDKNGVLVGVGTCKDAYIVVPQGVTAVGEGAFSNTKNILGVLLPKTVTEIRDNAFKSCDGLQVINIPEGVTEIGDSAFHSCKSLIGVLVPHSVTKIGKQAFANCGYLEIIYYVGTEADWTNVEKGQNWDQGAGKHVIEFKKPSSGDTPTPPPTPHEHKYSAVVTEPTCTEQGYTTYTCECGENYVDDYVDEKGHSWSEWTTVKEPTETEEGLKERYCACGEKESETLPKIEVAQQELSYYYSESTNSYHVSGIGTFTGTDLIIPSTYKGLPVTEIGYAFSNCNLLESVYIPNSIISIAEGAFMGCSNLQSVIFEKNSNLKTINYSAFASCTSLKNLILPESITFVARFAFDGCTSLEYNEYNGFFYLPSANNPYFALIKSKENSTNYTCEIYDGTKVIAGWALMGESSIYAVIIPDSVEYIGYGAFEDCSSLFKVTLPENLELINNSVFNSCNSINFIEFTNSVKYIGNCALQNCKSLQSIYFDGTIAEWFNMKKDVTWNDNTGKYVVYCIDGEITKDGTITHYPTQSEPSQGLEYELNYDGQSYSVVGIGTCTDTELVIPSMYQELPVTNIGANAFKECNFIVSVVIMEGIENIYQNAFRYCVNLESVSIPKSVKFLESFAGESVFFGCDKLLKSENGAFYVDDWFIVIDFNTVTDCLIIKEGTIGIAMNGLGALPSSAIVIPKSLKYISQYCIFMAYDFDTIYYCGDEESWLAVDIGLNNNQLVDAIVYYYSETAPSNEGYYWHYVDGVPTSW